MLLPPGDGNPAALLPPGTTNPGLAATQVAWDTYVQFFSGALTSAYNDLVDIQFMGDTGGRPPIIQPFV